MNLATMLNSSPHDIKNLVILPGLVNGEEYMDMLVRMAERVQREVTESEDGQFWNVPNAGRLLTVSGYSMNPQTLPQGVEWQQPHSELWWDTWNEWVAPLFFSDLAKFAPITQFTLRKDANNCYPQYTTSVMAKQHDVSDYIMNAKEIFRLTHMRRYRELANTYGIYYLNLLGTRWQVDSITIKLRDGGGFDITDEKVRYANLRDGSLVKCDKSIPGRPKNRAGRVRALSRTSTKTNVAPRRIAQFTYQRAKEVAGPTLTLTDMWDAITLNPDRWDGGTFTSADVTQFDNIMQDEAFNAHEQALIKYGDVNAGAAHAYNLVMCSPILGRCLYKRGTPGADKGPILIGDPMHPEDFRSIWRTCLASGSGPTAISARHEMITTKATGLRYLGILKTRDQFVDWLWHKLDIRDATYGDDIWWWTRDGKFGANFDQEYCEAMMKGNPSAKISPDPAPQALSTEIRKDRKHRWRAEPNVMRGFGNRTNPEYGMLPIWRNGDMLRNAATLDNYFGVTGVASDDVNSAHQRFQCFGFRQFDADYTERCSLWPQMREILMEEYAKAAPRGPDLLNFAADYEEQVLNHLGVNPTNVADIRFINSMGQSVNYRDDPVQISDGLMDIYYLSYEPKQMRQLDDAIFTPAA